MTLTEQLMQTVAADESEMLAIRRHLHPHPEISFHEGKRLLISNNIMPSLERPNDAVGRLWHTR